MNTINQQLEVINPPESKLEAAASVIDEQLEAAIRKLELVPDAESQISATISRLKLIGQLARLNDLPRNQQCGSEQAQKEIRKFAELAIALHNHIATMHSTCLGLLTHPKETAPELLLWDLERMVILAGMSIDQLKTVPDERKAKPIKRQAKDVTAAIAKSYETLTGKKPTRKIGGMTERPYGSLHQFAQEVFSALGMEKVSADSQLREYLKLHSPKKRL